MKTVDLKRRDFLRGLGIVALSVQVIPFAGAQEVPAPNADDKGLTVRSGKSRFAPLPDHFHNIFIAWALIQNPPPEGINIKTSICYLHCHKVVLTQSELVAISQRQTVTVADTVKDHQYVINLARLGLGK